MAGVLGAKWQQRFVGVLAATAAMTATRRRLHGVPVEPFSDAAGEGPGLGFWPRQAAVKMGDACPLVVEGPVVVSVPRCAPLQF